MKYLFILIFLLPFLIFGQVTNYTWGYTTAGASYTQTGTTNLDSNGTVTIIYDMQDYYFLDYLPLVMNDSAVVHLSSDRMNYGTFWYKWDLQNAADSIMYTIKAYPGFTDYHPNDGSRITVANIDYSTTATTLVDTTTGTYTTNDIQWTAVNLYLSDTEGKILPPEFIKVVMDLEQISCDSIDAYQCFVYPAVKEFDQDNRTTTRSQGEARKEKPTLH